jgi:hypothetical protein
VVDLVNRLESEARNARQGRLAAGSNTVASQWRSPERPKAAQMAA